MVVPNQPDQVQIEHSARLSALIGDEIENQGGWLGFESFMDLALYAPKLGYYSAGATKFGRDGDFITAPLLGDLFARCIGKQCAEIVGNLHGQQPTTIVEFGAGTGDMSHDILTYLDSVNSLPDQYLIIETSPDLKQLQKQKLETCLPEIIEKVYWVDALPEQGITGIIIANEVLDAMPVMRFHVNHATQVYEIGVGIEDHKLTWKNGSINIAHQLGKRVALDSLPRGYQSEIGNYAEAWTRTVGDKLNQGVAILIDYGFPAPEFYHWDRTQGTIMCHYQHTAHHDPFFYPGIQDITAHVNFSGIAQAGSEAGMDILGYCNQGAFLLSLGLLESLELEQKNAATSRRGIELSQEVKNLTLPHEMGEIFKVMALGKSYSLSLTGFNMQNHMGRL